MLCAEHSGRVQRLDPRVVVAKLAQHPSWRKLSARVVAERLRRLRAEHSRRAQRLDARVVVTKLAQHLFVVLAEGR